VPQFKVLASLTFKGTPLPPPRDTARRVVVIGSGLVAWWPGGLVAWWAKVPVRSSKASASRRCRVRRNVDSEGTAPVTPSTRRVCSSASAAHSAIAVNDRAPATTAQRQAQDHRQPVAHTLAIPRISDPGQHPQ